MGKLLKRIFSLKFIFAIASIIAVTSLFLAYLSPYIHPSKFKIVSLFGLAYPIIIIGNLSLLLLLIWRKSKWYILVGITIIAGGNLHFRTLAIGYNSAKTSSYVPLKVLSYNVHLFDLYNPKFKESVDTKNKILAYINEIDPDIACFQEFYNKNSSKEFSILKTISSNQDIKGTHKVFATNFGHNQSFGVFMYSKYPMINKGQVKFDQSATSFNYCIYTDILTPLDTIRVYNVHLQSIQFQQDDYALFDEENNIIAGENRSNVFKMIKKVANAFPIRAKQSETIMEHIKQSPYPVIVCGDFNDTPMSYTYNQFNTHLTDAFRNSRFGIGKTYAGPIPAGRIDYIFHSPSIHSSNFIVQDKKLSDHYAISCNIQLK